MKPQVIVVSHRRPEYLWSTLTSLRQDDIDLYVVDGGSDLAMQIKLDEQFSMGLLSGLITLADNKGFDAHRNMAIGRWAEQESIIISADDIIYPRGYSSILRSSFNALQPQWAMLFCNFPNVNQQAPQWQIRNGVELMETGAVQGSASILSVKAWKQIGGFPTEYGKSGQGDYAVGLRFQKAGYRVGYLRYPKVEHLGVNKWQDYPEYSADFQKDEMSTYEQAARDVLAK